MKPTDLTMNFSCPRVLGAAKRVANVESILAPLIEDRAESPSVTARTVRLLRSSAALSPWTSDFIIDKSTVPRVDAGFSVSV